MENSEKKRIILVEDEATLAHLIELRLRQAGYEVELAQDGQKGLDLIVSEKPDLVLLDMALPILNGFSVLEKLYEKKILPDLPIIIISNSGQPIEIKRAQNMGIRDYLIKVNFNPDELLMKVRDALNQDEQTPSPSQRVLIIEDDAILVKLLERAFKEQGYKTFVAPSATGAREFLRTQHIDVILLDLVLPDIDGFALLEEFKGDEKIKDIPIYIISNLNQKEEIERGMKAGAIDYIVKADVLPKEIVQKVNALIQKRT